MKTHSQERLLQVLVAPQISEKATFVADKNGQFVFFVTMDATKPEIKAAVETMFRVNVRGVCTTVTKGKRKRFAGGFGRRSDTKKAFVTLEAGQEINFVEGAN